MYAVTTTCAAIAAALLLVASYVFRVALPFPAPTMALLAAIGCFIFPGLAERSYNKWRTKIDDNIPNMLADVAGSVRSGFNITRAMELAADTDYGPLTEQLRIDKVQLSWGLTFAQVMRNVATRVVDWLPTLIVTFTFSCLPLAFLGIVKDSFAVPSVNDSACAITFP